MAKNGMARQAGISLANMWVKFRSASPLCTAHKPRSVAARSASSGAASPALTATLALSAPSCKYSALPQPELPSWPRPVC